MTGYHQQHNTLAMAVAQAAWDYVNPPVDDPAVPSAQLPAKRAERYGRLHDQAHRLRAFERKHLDQLEGRTLLNRS